MPSAVEPILEKESGDAHRNVNVTVDWKVLRKSAHAEDERIILRVVGKHFHFIVVIDSEATGDVTLAAVRLFANFDAHSAACPALHYDQMANLAFGFVEKRSNAIKV